MSQAKAAAPAPAPAKSARVSSATDAAERAADDMARRAVRGEEIPPALAIAHRLDRTRIHRQADDAPAPAGAPGGGLLVEDDAAPAAGQMRKTAFLDELYAALCRTVERGFEGTPYEGGGCPFLEQAIAAYRERPAADAEAALRRWAGESAGATTASGYIPVIEGRVRRSVQVYVATGEITGVPPDLLPLVPGLGGGLLAGFMSGGLLGGIGRAIGSGLSRLLFKERTGATAPPADPATVRARLGSGHSLDSGVQTRMERAFGSSFSHVRIHSDETSTRVAEGLSARAFTLGHHVAFAGGEYRPGTLTGDALIAHELAHVVQQGPGTAGAAAPALEADADEAAVDAVLGAGDARGRRSKKARPRRRTGLQLQRCASKPPPAAASPGTKPLTETKPATWAPRAKRGPSKDAPEMDNATWAKDLLAASAKTGEKEKAEAMFKLVEKALKGIGLTARMTDPSRKEPDPEKPGEPERVNSSDYDPAPVINFDLRLNEKWPPATVDKEDQEQLPNAGYSFLGPKGEAYVVLGPLSLMTPQEEAELKKDPQLKEARFRFDPTPDSVRMYAEHELLHAERGHLKTRLAKGKAEKKKKKKGERKSKDDPHELEAWTIDFVGYFHLQAKVWPSTGLYIGQRWQPLLEYYEAVTDAGAKEKTVNTLVNYYKSPPGEPAATRAIFDGWVKSRAGSGSSLVQRLASELRIDPKKRSR